MHGNIGKILRIIKKIEMPAAIFKIVSWNKMRYSCPVCSYNGPFRDVVGRWTSKKNTKCPNCGSTERTRMLWLVIEGELSDFDGLSKRAIHFAPEKILSPLLRQRFGVYETSNFGGREADHYADLRNLPFEDESYDFVIASHVLEHIKEDELAIKEIRRILKPGGIAILPVTLVGDVTIEYDAARPEEAGHVRAPGLDYFDRYRKAFAQVSMRSAEEFSDAFHLLPEMEGALGIHYIPVCRA